MERAESQDENVGKGPWLRFRRNKSLLVALVIQGLGLLFCLTYVCLHYYTLQAQHTYPPFESIRVQFTRCENGKCFLEIVQNVPETMTVQNNSIVINCDGYYLISLKGTFFLDVDVNLLYRKDWKPLLPLTKVRSMDAVTVAYLAYKDKIYLNVTSHTSGDPSSNNITVNEGELILIHQNPPGAYCFPKDGPRESDGNS
ncbi:PREDICTED: tumor necrosis factor ligand superfamily member 4 [Elephantulus edwardii]|uniref:tumor necrosis factor ligand superfamily member 4 n=1 Tax=Elephantulus edwardii TaxID=28737 RepID=UPI0003F0B302|nr:PREDICTED: tumor necrosis factor ligand superfamily member 4 [Elephantulus edwardii]